MSRAATVALLLILMTTPVLAQARDPGYDAVLESYQGKSWVEFDRLSAQFLEAQPNYRYAHSIRFMIADSLRQRKRLAEAADACIRYLERHPEENLADRCRGALIEILNADRRYEEALERATDYLDRYPRGKAAPRVAFEFASALEGLRRFDEAAAAYRTISGKYAERAASQRGVSLFRGRRFAEARQSLTAFLKSHPRSSYEARVRDYLFRCDTGFDRIRDGVVLDYDGKYQADERFIRLRRDLAKLRATALERIESFIGREIPRTFLIRFEDAGNDRSGFFAKTRLEVVDGKPVQVVILYTEYLMLSAHDPLTTLTHELYHCVQREALGEGHYLVPSWVREGTALYVAGQGEERTRLLAADAGRQLDRPDPMARLVNGLGGAHGFDDYAEDVAAFLAVEERHGRKKAVELLLALLEDPDVERVVAEVLGETMEEFEAAAAKRARETLAPLLANGRTEILEVRRCIGKQDWEGALAALPKDPGVYAPAASYYRSLSLYSTGRYQEALDEVRSGFLSRYRSFRPLLDEALYLKLSTMQKLGDPEFEAAAARARLDLTPTSMHARVVGLGGE